MRKTVDISGVDRDENKVYRITEMSAWKAEKIGLKIFFAMSDSSVDIPFDVVNAPLAKMVELGLVAISKIPFHILEPIFDEMIQCVSFVLPNGQSRNLLQDDIEEYMTILKIRKEVLALHLGFFTEKNPQTMD